MGHRPIADDENVVDDSVHRSVHEVDHQHRSERLPPSLRNTLLMSVQDREGIESIHPANPQSRQRPEMRVTAEDLAGSRVLDSLPEFLARLGKANQDLLAENGCKKKAAQIDQTLKLAVDQREMGQAEDQSAEEDSDDEEDDEEEYIEMDVLVGVLEQRPENDDSTEREEELGKLRIPSAGTMPSKRDGLEGPARSPVIQEVAGSSDNADSDDDDETSSSGSSSSSGSESDEEGDEAPSSRKRQTPDGENRSDDNSASALHQTKRQRLVVEVPVGGDEDSREVGSKVKDDDESSTQQG